MRKLASIQRIKSVEPIKGADRIELVHVLGWQCVATKGQFKPGDLCVYFEIDSFLPICPEFEFLRKNSYKKTDFMGEGFLLKTMRFKGQISQGLVVPLSDLAEKIGISNVILESKDAYENEYPVGEDVTKALGVREYEEPERATGSGTVIGQASKYIHITNETRIQSEPELLKEFKGLPYYITTKMDGSSHSICIAEDGTFHVFGHNFEYKDDGKSDFYEYVKKNNLEEKLRRFLDGENDGLSDTGYQIQSITVQGEWCGEGIQKNRMQLKQPTWFIFTVDYDGQRQNWHIIQGCADSLDMKTVPLEETGDDLTLKYPDEEALLKRAGENRCRAYPGQCEGIVVRPIEPVFSDVLSGPLSMKIINNKYLLKK